MSPFPSINIPDTGGLICGFALDADAKARPLVLQDVEKNEAHLTIPYWFHFNLADTRAGNWINSATLPEDARELLFDSDAHIRSENFDDGLALVIGDLHHDFKEDPEALGVLRLYLDNNRLITGRRHALKSVDRLRHELLGDYAFGNTIDLFGRLIYDIDDSVHVVIKRLNDQVDAAEDQILAGHLQNQGSGLGRIRRFTRTLAQASRCKSSGTHVRAAKYFALEHP